jgi:hypothetical protein
MNIINEALPNEVKELLETSFSTFSGEVFNSLSTVNKSTRGLNIEHPVSPYIFKEFGITTESLFQDAPLSNAYFIGWRSIDISNEGNFGSRLIGYSKYGNTEIIEYILGEYNYIYNEINTINDNEFFDDYYEVRCLNLPQVQVMAIWFFGIDTGESRFLLLEPYPSEFGKFQLFNEIDFFKVIFMLTNEAVSFISHQTSINNISN